MEEKELEYEFDIITPFNQLVTIITGNIYCDLEGIVNVLKNYYQREDNIKNTEIPMLLYKIKKDILFSDEKYSDIENFIQDYEDEWVMLQDGKERYGNDFKINLIKNKRIKYNSYYIDVMEKENSNSLGIL